MFYYTYLVVCTEGKFQGKVYFGCHRTQKLDDGYIASGRLIKDYIKKYPNEYYREIIKFYSSEEELREAERELIHPHLNKDYCLNLCEGGIWGTLSDEIRKQANDKKRGIKLWPNGRVFSEETKQKMSLAKKGKTTWTKGVKKSLEWRTKISNSLKGHKLSDEGKQKLSLRFSGENNPMYGKQSPSKGKHRVYDNKELNIYHYE